MYLCFNFFQVDFVVYNWSKECCERLQEHVTYLSHWIQARASLLSSLLLQKSGIFYCQPILPDNFGAGEAENSNPFIVGGGGGGGDIADIKDLIMNTPPTGKHERRSHHHHHAHHSVGMSGGPGAMSRLMSKLGMNVPGGPGVGGTVPSMIVMSNTTANPSPVGNKTPWKDFYRNMSLCQVLGMPEPVGENPVDAHGKQLYHVLNLQGNNKEPENNAFFQYWLTRGPSASNVITTQVLESFTQTARTIHFCLTPVMFLPTWRQAVAQTRDSTSFGGIVRRHRASSTRRYLSGASIGYGGHGQLHAPQASKLNLPPSSSSAAASAALIQAQRTRHGSEASQASSLASLRNRSKSYHSGMVNLLLHPEVISEKDFETGGGGASLGASPLQQQQQNLLLKVRSDEPWHGVLCRTFLQEYMQYLQTLGFVPVHRKASPSTGSGSGAGGGTSGTTGGGVGSPPGAVPGNHLKRGVPSGGTNRPVHINRDAQKSNKQGTVPGAGTAGGPGIPGGGGGSGTPSAGGDNNLDEDEDEKMIHFLQRCLPGGIIVIEVGLVPPFFYCKIHALEAKRIFPSKKTNNFNSSSVAQKNALQFVDECEKMKVLTHLHSFMYDFHLRAMFLYISGRQLLFKTGYHITTFLDDFITYYPKWPNYSRNAVHIGVVTLEDVVTPSQVLFNYITSHDKYYRMKVIRMTPLGASGGAAEDATSSSEYVLVHNMSRKVSYRSSDRGAGGSSGGGEDQQVPEAPSGQQNLDEFDLTLVIAHDYPSANRAFVPNFQGLRVKYYIVLTSRRELYPKGGGDLGSEPNTGKLCPVSTPAPLCSRHNPNCPLSSSCGGGGGMVGGGASGGSGVGIFNKFVSPPAPPPSYFDGFEGHHHFHHPPALQHHASMVNHHPQRNRQLINNPFGSPAAYNPYQNHQYQPPYQFPDMIREEKVRYMGYFSSHEQLMQKMIDEQKDTMEQFIRQLITKAAVDCRRELLWQRLLYGRPSPDIKIGKGNSRSSKVTSFSSAASSSSSTSNTNLLKEDIISRETVGPLSYQDFNELLGLVQVVPLNKVDPRVEELLAQPVTFYQTLIKVLMASIVVTHQHHHLSLAASASPLYSYREFVSMDQKIHQLAIFTPDAHKAIVMVEVNMDQAKCDIYVVVKENKKGDQQSGGGSGGGGGVPSIGDLGEGMYSLVEKVVNACCYATWTTLI